MENSVFLTERSIWNSHAKRHRNGKIKVGIQSKSGIAMKILGTARSSQNFYIAGRKID